MKVCINYSARATYGCSCVSEAQSCLLQKSQKHALAHEAVVGSLICYSIIQLLPYIRNQDSMVQVTNCPLQSLAITRLKLIGIDFFGVAPSYSNVPYEAYIADLLCSL